jgi:hypothetical protein
MLRNSPTDSLAPIRRARDPRGAPASTHAAIANDGIDAGLSSAFPSFGIRIITDIYLHKNQKNVHLTKN